MMHMQSCKAIVVPLNYSIILFIGAVYIRILCTTK